MDEPLVIFVLCLLGAAALGVMLAWAHSVTWPVDTGTHTFHRPIQPRANRDASARRH